MSTTRAGQEWLQRYLRYGRLAAVPLTLLATLLGGFTKETDTSASYNSLTGISSFSSISVKSTDSSSFSYFIAANAIVLLYSVVSIVLSYIRKLHTRFELPLLIGDITALILLFTGNAAAAAIEVVAWNGISQYGWNKFCNVTTNFCSLVVAANVVSSLAATLYFLMIVVSLTVIHKRSQV